MDRLLRNTVKNIVTPNNEIDTKKRLIMNTTFKVTVRKMRKDGLWPVYIRLIHNRKSAYIMTDKLVASKYLSATMEVTDPYVLQACNKRIVEYVDALNRQETAHWSVQEVAEYLKNGGDDVCFSDYARQHIDRLIDNGQERTSRNYQLALQHLERFIGTNKVMFSMLTSHLLQSWLASLEHTHRAKEMYPVCMLQVWKAAWQELNDEERGVVRIKFNPWMKVKIPHADRTEKLAITPEACREFFTAPLPESKFKSPLPEFGRDVAMMVLCLGGINTVDLYNLRKEDYHSGIIHYKRAKTRKFRADEAYMEMRVPPILFPLFEKYRSDDEWLFNFHSRLTSSDSFNANVNIGIRKICESMGMAKEDWYCVYTFRHTWGTIAQNDCGASIEEVAFGMNHSAGHRVTRGYLKLNFAPAWELNEKVVDFVFFTDKQSERTQQDEQPPKGMLSRFSGKRLMRGTVYFRGRELGKVEDIGFNNVDEIIHTLVPFVPDDVPEGSIVHFKVVNVDNGEMAVYARQKGKGF